MYPELPRSRSLPPCGLTTSGSPAPERPKEARGRGLGGGAREDGRTRPLDRNGSDYFSGPWAIWKEGTNYGTGSAARPSSRAPPTPPSLPLVAPGGLTTSVHARRPSYPVGVLDAHSSPTSARSSIRCFGCRLVGSQPLRLPRTGATNGSEGEGVGGRGTRGWAHTSA
jgi:hypothetical protein